MRFGLDVAQQRMTWDELVRRVQLAEELGFEGVWGFDHFQPMYGEGPGETFEGMTTLAALAGVTSRIRLGLLVTGVTYRHPSVLAAQAVTVDHASHGRLDLSLGAAWYDKEHHELGIPFPPLAERYDAARGHPRDREPPVHRRGRVVRRAGGLADRMRSCDRFRCSSPVRRSGSAAPGPSARSRSWPGTPTCGTASARPTRWPRPRRGWTSWPPRRAVTRRRSCGPASLSLDDADQARKFAGKWRDAGLRLPRVRLARRGRRRGRAVRPRGHARLRRLSGRADGTFAAAQLSRRRPGAAGRHSPVSNTATRRWNRQVPSSWWSVSW